MEIFHNLVMGFGVAVTPIHLLYALIGCLLGTLIGVLPGIGPVATIAMLLPITFNLSPVAALIMLAGIYYGAQYGGSTTAILVNIPGESSSVVTCLDGYQMARQGRAGPALAVAALGSFFAGCVSTLIIALAAPPLAEVALKFGPSEYFSLMVFGLVAATVLAHGSLIKAIAMVVFGLLLGIVGTDVNSGVLRFTFNIPELSDGIGFVIVAMGMFGTAEIVANLELKDKREIFTKDVKNLWPTREDFKRAWAPVMRGTALGSFLGILPGGGALLASFGAYTMEKKVSRHPEQFGKGAIEGGAGVGQQRRRPDLVHPDADAGHPEQRGDGADDRRADDPGHRARAAGDEREAAAVLGADRLDVGRQPDAGRPQPAADRHVGQAADRAVPLPVPVDPGVHGDRRVQPVEQRLRRADHGGVRRSGLHLRQARVRAGADDPRLHPRAADGGEPEARDAALARRSDDLHLQADQRRLHHRGDDPADRGGAAGDPQEARRGVRRGSLERRDRLHFEQVLLAQQAVDDEQRVGRIGAVREHAGEFAQPELHEFRDVLRVHQVGGELHYVRPAGAGRFQRFLDLGEHAGALRVEVVAGRQHAGNEKEFTGLDPGHVRVLAERLAQGVNVVDADVCHGSWSA